MASEPLGFGSAFAVTMASRQGGSPGWPSLGKRSAKSASAKMAPSSSRRLSSGLPLRKAALATRAVPSGTGSIGVGLSDMAGLRRGGPATAYPPGPAQPTSPTISHRPYERPFPERLLPALQRYLDG